MVALRRNIAIIASVALVWGCNLFGPSQSAEDRVFYRIAASYEGRPLASSRTVVPEAPSIASYTLWGTDAAPATLDELLSFASPTGVEIALTPGTWTFKLEAKSLENVTLLEKTLEGVTVGAEPGTLNFDLEPLAVGSGTVDIEASWPGGLPTDVASIETRITGLDPAIATYTLDPPLAVASDSFVFSQAGFAAGEYLFAFKLKDSSGSLLTTISELVRVAPGLTSRRVYNLVAGDFASPPAAPTNPSVSYGSMSVAFGWIDASDTETGFEIERSIDNGSNWSWLGSVGAGSESYDDASITRGATYLYRITAVNSFGMLEGTTSASIGIPYLLVFDPMGGSPAASGIEALADDLVVLPIAPTLAGYSFFRWNTQADGTGSDYLAAGDFYMPPWNATLYAKWTINSYYLNYHGNGSDGGVVPPEKYSLYDAAVTVDGPGSMTRTGFGFVNWNALADGTGTTYTPGSIILMPASDLTLYAQWDANSYTLSYNGNGATAGTAPAPVDYDYSAAVTTAAASTFTRAGYVFAGWNTASDGSGTGYAAETGIAMPAGSITLYARWIAYANTLSFNANGGSGSMDSMIADTDETIALATNVFVRTGYSFAGWDTLSDGGGTAYADGSSYTMGAASAIFFAQWTANSYNIVFSANGGTGTMTNLAIAYDATAVLTANAFTRIGHSFVSWNTLAGGGGAAYANSADYTMVSTSTVTLYAQWTTNSYVVAFAANGGTGSMSNQSIAYDNTEALAANAFARTGYSFTGWNTVAGGGGTGYADGANYTMASTSAVTLYAQWTANNYVVAFAANGADAGTMADQTFAYDTTAALTANAFTRTGYSFVGWDTNSGGGGTSYADGANFTMSTANSVTLFAQWTVNTYDVVFNANGGLGSMADEGIAYGATAALTANAFTNAGYNFAGWNTLSGGGGTAYADSGDFTMPSAATVTLYAQWTAINYLIAFAANGGDAGTMVDQTLAYDAMAALTTNAFSRTGYSFAGWNTGSGGGGASYADGANFTMSTNYSITLFAQWAVNTYDVVFNANGGSGSMTNEGIAYGATAALTANAFSRTGYAFAGWNTLSGGGGANYANGGNYTMLATSNVALYAQWSLNNYTITYYGNGYDSGTVPSAAIYDYGSTAAIAAAGSMARNGYSFGAWNTQANGSGDAYAANATFAMPANGIDLYAQWIQNGSVNLTIAVPGEPLVNLTTTGQIDAQREALISATASVTNSTAYGYEWYADYALQAETTATFAYTVPAAAPLGSIIRITVVADTAAGVRDLSFTVRVTQ